MGFGCRNGVLHLLGLLCAIGHRDKVLGYTIVLGERLKMEHIVLFLDEVLLDVLGRSLLLVDASSEEGLVVLVVVVCIGHLINPQGFVLL